MDTVDDGNMRPITSNAIFDVLTGHNITSEGDPYYFSEFKKAWNLMTEHTKMEEVVSTNGMYTLCLMMKQGIYGVILAIRPGYVTVYRTLDSGTSWEYKNLNDYRD